MSTLRVLLVAALLSCPVEAVIARAQQGQLVDRTVAVVSGTIILMTDARAALDLGFVEPAGDEDPVAVAAAWLVDRQLVLDEAARYGTPPPEPRRIEEAVGQIRARWKDPGAFDRRLEALGLSEDDLRLLVRGNLLAATYVDRRFDAATSVTETEAQEYYRLRVDQFVRDGRSLPFDEARDAVYEAIGRERRARAVEDWLVGLRRRSEVNMLVVRRSGDGDRR